MRILELTASAQPSDRSASRSLSRALVGRLSAGHGAEVIRRDLAAGLPAVDEAFVRAIETPEVERSPAQRERLRLSDALVDELAAADVLVIATPLYNFGAPATLKSWIDHVARAGRTFRYTESGAEGLLPDRKVFVVVASGGTEIGGPLDFATPWLRFVLAFLGLHDVEVIGAPAGEDSLARARSEITARADAALAARLARAA